MIVELATFPDLPRSQQTVTLEDNQYRVRLTWRPRLNGWYLDLTELDETPIAVGRRLSPGWGPLIGLLPAEAPAGLFYVRGPSEYEQGSLGDSLKLLYYDSTDLPAGTQDTEVLHITVT